MLLSIFHIFLNEDVSETCMIDKDDFNEKYLDYINKKKKLKHKRKFQERKINHFLWNIRRDQI